ncbi:hypothetical protein ABVV53_14120 [Novosphingobium sp. RD2P27]|uniref:Lipoprotein n=1 Tax=Novosphingobium kalidii TaxID=3230299 RepID=A0ABV2D3X8_9SPHN
MPRSGLLVLAVSAGVTGCSPEPAEVAADEERIACAVGGAQEFEEVCAVDRSKADGKLALVVRHPDGAFRRFAVVTDGRGLVVADGAEEAVTRIEGGKLAVAVGEDRYMFPASIKTAQTDAR